MWALVGSQAGEAYWRTLVPGVTAAAPRDATNVTDLTGVTGSASEARWLGGSERRAIGGLQGSR